MTNILCIETSTDICSVCIAQDSILLSIKETERSYSHSEVITVFIKDCLKEAKLNIEQLDAVAVTSGPGSYTALRIGSSTAKGICYALNIPLISVDTMKSLAEGIKEHLNDGNLAIPLLDARRDEVYRAVFDHNLTEKVPVSPLILNSSSFLEYKDVNTIHTCGDGAEKAKSLLSLENIRFHDIEASSKYMINEAFVKFTANQVEDTAYYTPYYFKSPNITVQKKNILL